MSHVDVVLLWGAPLDCAGVIGWPQLHCIAAGVVQGFIEVDLDQAHTAIIKYEVKHGIVRLLESYRCI